MCRESLVRFQPGWASISRRIHFRSFASNVRLGTYNDSIFGSHYTERNSETSKKSRLAKNLEFYPAILSRNVQTAGPRSSGRTGHKDVDTRRPLTKNVISSVDLESRFYAVLESCLKWPSVKSTPIEVPGIETAKRPRKCSNKQKGSKWCSYGWHEYNERIHRKK